MEENKIVYPDDIILPEGLENKKDDEVRRSLRYPTSNLYDDFFYICKKAGLSLNKVLIGFVSEFVKKNNHVLKKKQSL